MNAADIFEQLLQQKGGDYGEAYNETENARQGNATGPLAGLDPATLVEVNRMAQSADTPATAALAAPYEGLKAAEQQTGLPFVTGPGKLLRAAGVPVALPNATTCPASMGNVKASVQGALYRLLAGLKRGTGNSAPQLGVMDTLQNLMRR